MHGGQMKGRGPGAADHPEGLPQHDVHLPRHQQQQRTVRNLHAHAASGARKGDRDENGQLELISWLTMRYRAWLERMTISLNLYSNKWHTHFVCA